MMEQAKTFSVIIPAFNAAGRIRNVLDSVKVQTFRDYECIVVCDSCTDNTHEIVESYGFKAIDVNFGNDGLSRSRGLDEATGKWVMFLDDDDCWLHEFVLYGVALHLRDDIDILQMAFIWGGKGYALVNPDGTPFPNVWSKCWRREFIGDTRFPNIYSVSDKHFTDAMLAKSPRIETWDSPIYYYNWMRPGSITEQEAR